MSVKKIFNKKKNFSMKNIFTKIFDKKQSDGRQFKDNCFGKKN